MFGLGEKKSKDIAEGEKQNSKKVTTVDPAQDVEVRTMPEKFLGVKPAKKSLFGGKRSSAPKKELSVRSYDSKNTKTQFDKPEDQGIKRNIIVGVVVIVVLGVGMAVAAFFVVRSLNNDTIPEGEVVPVVEMPLQQDVQPIEQQEPVIQEPIVEELVIEEETPVTEEPIFEDIELYEPGDSPEAFPSQPEINLDPDGDGLMAPEETLFGTSSGNSDTDADGYLDGSEVINLFDPRFGEGAKLADSNSVKTYLSTDSQYKVLVPTSWIEEVIGTTNTFVRFTADNGDGFFEITTEGNTTGVLDAREWYREQFSVVGDVNLATIEGQNISGILSPDGLVAYFVSQDTVYMLTYNPAGAVQLRYPTIFKMMVRSFTLFDNPLSE